MNSFLEPTTKNENDENERNADQDDSPFSNRTSHAKARGQPHAGCRGQSMDGLTFIPDDNARAQKPNSGQDALNNAACVGAASPTNGEDGQCRPNPDEAKRPNAGWLAVKIAVKAQRDAGQRRSAEPQSNVESIHSGTI